MVLTGGILRSASPDLEKLACLIRAALFSLPSLVLLGMGAVLKSLVGLNKSAWSRRSLVQNQPFSLFEADFPVLLCTVIAALSGFRSVSVLVSALGSEAHWVYRRDHFFLREPHFMMVLLRGRHAVHIFPRQILEGNPSSDSLTFKTVKAV